jgi:hypothetical protein
MMMMMRVLSIVVISVLPPTVELLELIPCNHLVSFLLDVLEGGGGVVSSVLLSTASSSVLSLSMTPCELVGDLVLENVGPSVDGQLVLGVLLRLDGLLNLVLLGNLHVNFVLGNVDPSVDCWRVLSVLLRLVNLGNFVPTQACFLLASDLSSECITK